MSYTISFSLKQVLIIIVSLSIPASTYLSPIAKLTLAENVFSLRNCGDYLLLVFFSSFFPKFSVRTL